MYGSEIWVLNNRLQATGKRWLISVICVTEMVSIRNYIIRKELKIALIQQTLEENKLKWLSYSCMVRVNVERPTRFVWEAKHRGTRMRRRPEKAWNMVEANILMKWNLNCVEVR